MKQIKKPDKWYKLAGKAANDGWIYLNEPCITHYAMELRKAYEFGRRRRILCSNCGRTYIFSKRTDKKHGIGICDNKKSESIRTYDNGIRNYGE